MSTPIRTFGDTVWELPPLILHPFNERVPPAALLENSRAALMLAGLIPDDGTDPEALERRLLSGRYSEVRMLFFLGKDIFRWIAQCLEWLEREPQLQSAELAGQSFAGLLTADPPEVVRQKLLQWGVADYCSIFSRAIGLKALFSMRQDAARQDSRCAGTRAELSNYKTTHCRALKIVAEDESRRFSHTFFLLVSQILIECCRTCLLMKTKGHSSHRS